jgi:Protein of unknown function (DUF998)/DDE superfamily endonuclease
LPIDRVGMACGYDRAFYSGKYKRHGMNVQVLADPAGRLVWASPALPGARHDMGAAREHGLIEGLGSGGIARSWRSGRAAKVVPAVVAVFGICLAASGLFTTDHAVVFTQQSAHGRIHGLLGAVVFLAMPTCCFLVAARSRRDAVPHGTLSCSPAARVPTPTWFS